MIARFFLYTSLMFAIFINILAAQPARAGFLDEVGSVAEEQAKEKEELKKMRNEVKDINDTIGGAMNQLNQLNDQMTQQQSQNLKEIHLFARDGSWQTRDGDESECLMYNGKIPGPVIQVTQGDPVKIVLHNQMKTSTSLYFHGLKLPHELGGLPRSGQGLVEPGQSFVFQFIAEQPGTYWYHPQIVHADQKLLGLYGVLIVGPKLKSRSSDKDLSLILSKLDTVKETATVKKPDQKAKATSIVKQKAVIAGQPESTHYLINGKEAPAIPPLELHNGDRVKLRLVNAGDEPVPLHISGHKLEITSINGGDRLEPHVFRDNITLNPSDRVDVEFNANNPGIWSLASEVFNQSTRDGKFPGGMAMVVRYSQLKAKQKSTSP